MGTRGERVPLNRRERIEAAFRDLFERAGFQLTRVVPTESPFSVIEGGRV
jgi:hypothetical protein